MKKIFLIITAFLLLTGQIFAGGSSESVNKAEVKKVGELSEIYLTANGTTWTVTLEQNKSAAALVELLQKGDVTIHAHEYGGFEKVGSLGTSLPRTDTQISSKPGDLILYGGNQITFFYGSNSWSYTRLGRVKDATRESLLATLGSGDVDLTLSLTK